MLLTACGGGGGGSSPSSGPLPPLPPATKGKYFTHVVILVQENRTFDNLFSTYPGADGTRTGELHDGSRVALLEHDLFDVGAPSNDHAAWLLGYNGGKMNGFDLINFGKYPSRVSISTSIRRRSSRIGRWLRSTFSPIICFRLRAAGALLHIRI